MPLYPSDSSGWSSFSKKSNVYKCNYASGSNMQNETDNLWEYNMKDQDVYSAEQDAPFSNNKTFFLGHDSLKFSNMVSENSNDTITEGIYGSLGINYNFFQRGNCCNTGWMGFLLPMIMLK